MSDKLRKIYWRLKRDGEDGSMAFQAGWIVSRPAKGLIEIGDTPRALSGTVLKISEIEYEVAI